MHIFTARMLKNHNQSSLKPTTFDLNSGPVFSHTCKISCYRCVQCLLSRCFWVHQYMSSFGASKCLSHVQRSLAILILHAPRRHHKVIMKGPRDWTCAATRITPQEIKNMHSNNRYIRYLNSNDIDSFRQRQHTVTTTFVVEIVHPSAAISQLIESDLVSFWCCWDFSRHHDLMWDCDCVTYATCDAAHSLWAWLQTSPAASSFIDLAVYNLNFSICELIAPNDGTRGILTRIEVCTKATLQAIKELRNVIGKWSINKVNIQQCWVIGAIHTMNIAAIIR